MKKGIWIALIGLLWIGMSACEKVQDLQFVRVAGVTFESLGFTESKVRVELAYYNPNKFNLRLKDASFDVFFDDVQVGHTNQDTLIEIPAKDTFYFPVRMDVNMKNVLSNALTAFSNKEVTIRATGNCKVGKGGVYLPFPIKCETKQKLNFF